MANGIAPQLARRPGHTPRVGALGAGLRVLVAFQCLLLAPAIVWAEPIVHLLLGPKYEQSADVLVALAPHMFFTGFAPLVSITVNYLGEARRRMPIALVTLALSVGGALLLIPPLGVVGAAITSDIALGFYTLGHLWLCRRLLHVPLLPLVWALACGLTAAGGMGVVLTLVGTERELSLLQWVGGATGGVAVYLAILVFTRELTAAELRRVGEVVGAKLGRKGARAGRTVATTQAPPAPPAPATALVPSGDPAAPPPAVSSPVRTSTVPSEAETVYEVVWCGTRDGGRFELRATQEGHVIDAPVPGMVSAELDWRWGVPPAPILEARHVHGDLLDRLLSDGWRPVEWGSSWYAARFVRG